MSGSSLPDRVRLAEANAGTPFEITKIGHVVLHCRDLERSVRFYTQVLGFKISDVYDESMIPGGMCFMRFSPDHHGVALVGHMPEGAAQNAMHHMAFAVTTLDEVFRAREHLEKCNVPIKFHGRRRAGVQIAVEFADPDGHMLEIYWGLDQVGTDGITRPAAEWKAAHSLEEAISNPVRGQKPVVNDERLIRKS